MPPKKPRKSKSPMTKEMVELRQQLKIFDSEKLKERRERKVARLAERQKYLQAQQRANNRLEYDRLVGESSLIPLIRREHGDLVAERHASGLYQRLTDLKGIYKQALQGTKHEIDK